MKRNTLLDRLNPFARRAARSGNRRRPSSARRRLVFEGLEQRSLLAVLTVTSDADITDPDDSVLTLREAILAANADSDPDTIAFDINPGGAQTITLGTSALPSITDPVNIDGSTQGGLITINAAAVTGTVMTVQAGADGTTLSGFNISNAANTAIQLSGTSENRLVGIVVDNIDVSWEGTERTGGGIAVKFSDGNTMQNVTANKRWVGINLSDSSSNTITENDVSGSRYGISVGRGSGNTIQNNIASGTSYGISLTATDHNTVEGNDVSASLIFGIALSDDDRLPDNPTSGNVIRGNDASGSSCGIRSQTKYGRGNQYLDNNVSSTPTYETTYGIVIINDREFVLNGNDFTKSNTGLYLGNMDGILLNPERIGDDVTTLTTAGSVWPGAALTLTDVTNSTVAGLNLSLNLSLPPDVTRGAGLKITGGSGNTIQDVTATDRHYGLYIFKSDVNTIVDCQMTDASDSGIYLYESSHNLIEGNTLTGGLHGVRLWAGSDENWVESNNAFETGTGIYLGSADGNAILGNNLSANNVGIRLVFDSSLNTIAENYVSGSSSSGIAVTSGSGNRIQGNSIHSNGGLGIDLAPSGVTANDPCDADTGANNLQNFPVLSEVDGGPTTEIRGSLNSTPSTTFTLDFYANSVADPSGYGEGERWLGAITVTTEENGDWDFDAVLPAPTTPGEVITATATEDLPEIVVDPGTPDDTTDDYTIHPGNTSEFSAGMAVEGAMVEIDVKPGSDSNPVNLNSNGVIAVVILADANFDPSCVQVDTVVFAGAHAAQHAFEDTDADGDLDLVMHFRIEDTNLEEIYQQLLADDQDADGVLDSTHQEVQAWLFGQTTLDELFAGVDEMDVALSGRHLRELLDELFGAGTA